jgi:hypothetical protein
MLYVEEAAVLEHARDLGYQAFGFSKLLEDVQIAMAKIVHDTGDLFVGLAAEDCRDNAPSGRAGYDAWKQTLVPQTFDNANVVHSKSATS